MHYFLKNGWMFFILVHLFSCKTREQSTLKKKYTRHVGDIQFDADLDKADFELCYGEDKVYQYFNLSKGLQYEGERTAIFKTFAEKYVAPENSTETGSIRIRFIVNCKAETDRFRMIAMDSKYQERKFDEAITNQLLKISKGLTGWKVQTDYDLPVDYYQYLIFKIETGQIKEILP